MYLLEEAHSVRSRPLPPIVPPKLSRPGRGKLQQLRHSWSRLIFHTAGGSIPRHKSTILRLTFNNSTCSVRYGYRTVRNRGLFCLEGDDSDLRIDMASMSPTHPSHSCTQCGKPAKLWCQACRHRHDTTSTDGTWYCSKDCQNVD